MNTLPVHLFKSSFGAFLQLLNEHEVKYQMRTVRSGVPVASAETLEILKVVGSAAFWPSLATVVVAFIRARSGRKVIITTQGKTVIHANGLSMQELQIVLQHAANITAIDTNIKKEDGELID